MAKRQAEIADRSEPRNPVVGLGKKPRKELDLTHFVRWPRYIRLQRQRSIISRRLKVPVQIAQFRNPIKKQFDTQLVNFAKKYAPETKAEKKARLEKLATLKAAGEELPKETNEHLIFGMNNVTKAIERKQAKLVLIAHDTDPIDLTVWMPSLCHRMEVPYAIVRSTARLGQLVHMKQCTCVALKDIKQADQREFTTILDAVASEVDYEKETAPRHHHQKQ